MLNLELYKMVIMIPRSKVQPEYKIQIARNCPRHPPRARKKVEIWPDASNERLVSL